MTMDRCRVCGHEFFKEPLLKYSNMPCYAQYLPDAASLESDKGIDLEVCQCSGCGLVQLSNDPVPYYREVIRAAAFSDEMKGFRIGQFGSFIERYSLKGKKVIEIGCGRGEYLALMQRCGADTFGLEYLEESVMECRKNDLRVSKGFIDDSSYEMDNAPFDAFYILNFLEHLPDPSSTFRGIHNNLAEDAIGLVEVPNFDMILRNKLFSEFIGDHLFYFTGETLKGLLKLNGFEIVECNEVWYDYIISVVVRKKGRIEMSHFYSHQEQLKNEIDEYLSRFKNKNVAIWGAGHQALAVISLANLTDKIRYVIDSAPFKQGKYTPATHIPIISPEMLDQDPVDAIIVMAGSYSDEVARIIKQRFDKQISVSIMRNFGLEII
jgi:SAM-dependent methyltransferase